MTHLNSLLLAVDTWMVIVFPVLALLVGAGLGYTIVRVIQNKISKKRSAQKLDEASTRAEEMLKHAESESKSILKNAEAESRRLKQIGRAHV